MNKKIKIFIMEKKNVQNLKWATAHLSRGAGRWGAGRWGAGVRRRGRWARSAGSRRWGVRGRARGARTGAGGTDGRAGRGRRGATGKARTRGGARQALARGAGERAARRGRSERQAGAGRVRRTAWARGVRGPGMPGHAWCTGWASLGLMPPVWVLTWVFDSVVFMSHGLDSVHEHCSLQKFFQKNFFFKLKKNQINFDKIFEK